MPIGEIPVGPFRERFLVLQRRGEISEAQLADRLGFYVGQNGSRRPDGRRAMRTIGLKPGRSRGQTYVNGRVTRGNAEKLCRALHLDPHEGGL